jgi:hypothetical protein
LKREDDEHEAGQRDGGDGGGRRWQPVQFLKNFFAL